MQPVSDGLFYIDKWCISPQEGHITDGVQVIHLEPKTMDVLVYFASRPNEVISREEFEQHVWHGAIIGYDAVTNTIIKLRKAMGDNARQPHIIATIPKKGYQLVAEVRRGDDIPGSTDTTKTIITPAPLSRFWPYIFGLALLLLIGAGFIFSGQNATTTTDAAPVSSNDDPVNQRPSIVVLPFENLSDEPQQAYLADGITDDIITDLSSLSNILVIASNTSSIYRDKLISSREIGKELNVKFILKGSIRPVADTIRVNTQLINTETGFNVWARRYDRKKQEFFAVQDEVIQSIVSSLTVRISQQEQIRITQRSTNNLKAYDYFQEGQRLYAQRTKSSLQQARVSYKKAIELDPDYGRAYGAMSITLANDYQRGWADNPRESLDRALELARKATALNSFTPQTYWALSFAHLVRKEHSLAEEVINQAIKIAPNYADGIALLGTIKVWQGHTDESIRLVHKAMRLNPFYSWQYLFTLGVANYQIGNYSEAITQLEKAQRRNENALRVKYFLAATYVKANRLADAQWLIEELDTINDGVTFSDLETIIPIADIDLKQEFFTDLRKAGLKK